MLEDLQKTFDAAFLSADHNLKLAATYFENDDHVPLFPDELPKNFGATLESSGSSLATMAFCFSQLLAKTILYSENYFILKEKYQALEVANYQYKSDKAFMEFSRKLAGLETINGKDPKTNRISSNEMRTHYDSFVADRMSPNQRPLTKKPLVGELQDSSFKIATTATVTKRRSRARLRPKLPAAATKVSIRDLSPAAGLERAFLGNAIRAHLYRNPDFFGGRCAYNRRTFRDLYRHFKEVEYLSELERRNVRLQKEAVGLKAELSNYRLVVCYLNNQLSGRIQQIQLLTRTRHEADFDKIWGDIEAGIQLNKFKTIIHALGAVHRFTETEEHRTLFDMIHAKSNVSLQRPKLKSMVQESIDQNDPKQSLDVTLALPSSAEADTSSTALDHAYFQKHELKAFPASWFNFGLLRFVFADFTDEGLGVAIIGGKEYGLPILISQIYADSPAAKTSAFRVGDIVLTVNFQDVTDMLHDEVVILLNSLSGKCRFGLIYLKPTITDREGAVAGGAGDKLAYGGQIDPKSGGPPSLGVFTSGGRQLDWVDVARLCTDYYRSVYNTLISAPLAAVVDTDDSDSFSNASYSSSEITVSSTTPSVTEEEETEAGEEGRETSFGNCGHGGVEKEIQDTSLPPPITVAQITPRPGEITDLIDSSNVKRSAVKSFPGMAARV